tara:strand:- start:675 stop:1244 length:570 start_codon:yes stop_codon:yes gene_type:complete
LKVSATVTLKSDVLDPQGKVVNQTLKNMGFKNVLNIRQGEFFREVVGIKEGPPPDVNLFNEKNNGLLVKNLISRKLLNSLHDISSGGMILSLCEMCISGKIGAKIKIPNNNIGLHEYLFSEDQSRYLVEINTKNRDIVTKILEENSIYYEVIGKTQKNNLDLDGEFNISLEELNKLNSYWFKNFFKESC